MIYYKIEYITLKYRLLYYNLAIYSQWILIVRQYCPDSLLYAESLMDQFRNGNMDAFEESNAGANNPQMNPYMNY